ncbi:hypothetical protein C8R43DRAFT_1156490 [Mycena crocata]|nr:hypothetical protein C8R43DRAFT_1156490 [Mycena crocata]
MWLVRLTSVRCVNPFPLFAQTCELNSAFLLTSTTGTDLDAPDQLHRRISYLVTFAGKIVPISHSFPSPTPSFEARFPDRSCPNNAKLINNLSFNMESIFAFSSHEFSLGSFKRSNCSQIGPNPALEASNSLTNGAYAEVLWVFCDVYQFKFEGSNLRGSLLKALKFYSALREFSFKPYFETSDYFCPGSKPLMVSLVVFSSNLKAGFNRGLHMTQVESIVRVGFLQSEPKVCQGFARSPWGHNAESMAVLTQVKGSRLLSFQFTRYRFDFKFESIPSSSTGPNRSLNSRYTRLSSCCKSDGIVNVWMTLHIQQFQHRGRPGCIYKNGIQILGTISPPSLASNVSVATSKVRHILIVPFVFARSQCWNWKLYLGTQQRSSSFGPAPYLTALSRFTKSSNGRSIVEKPHTRASNSYLSFSLTTFNKHRLHDISRSRERAELAAARCLSRGSRKAELPQYTMSRVPAGIADCLAFSPANGLNFDLPELNCLEFRATHGVYQCIPSGTSFPMYCFFQSITLLALIA